MKTVEPIFIFSLGRSGSTLLQRILGTNVNISTVSEPWFLLPLLYSTRREGVYAEYGHKVTSTAIKDFCRTLPNGYEDYRESIRSMAITLYEKASPQGVRYFLDKTPWYFLIAEEILDLFPSAKIIVLWRNPLSVLASFSSTFSAGRWNAHVFKALLYNGLDNLARCTSKHAERIHSVKFEELILDSETVCRDIFDYLELEFDKAAIQEFSQVDLRGRFVDPTGTKNYKELDKEPLQKWEKDLASAPRKWWARRYIEWIGDERLNIMGYDKASLMTELERVPTTYRNALPDVVKMIYGSLYSSMELPAIKDKFRAGAWSNIIAHT